MSADEHLTCILDLNRQIAALQAAQARHVAAFVDDPCTDSPAPALEKDYLPEQLRAALGESATACGNRIHDARTLVHRLPATLTALEQGALTWRHATALVNAVTDLDDPAATRIETRCVPFAAGRDYTAFTRKIRRELAALDPATLDDRLQAAIDRLTVWHRPDPDGLTATVGAVLPAADARTVITAIDTAADLDPDHGKTLDQRRADALTRIAADWLTHTPTRTGPTPAPQVQLTIALSTLLRLDQQPADLDGHGPLPAELARDLVADLLTDPTTRWRRLLIDDHGHLLDHLDHGRTRYRPPARLRELIVARDRECQFPGCHRQGRFCEIDHLQAWADGGTTDPDNLICLCPRHHHLKHDTTWTIHKHPDGTLHWTSPTGRTHTNEPATYPTDNTTTIGAAA